MLFRPENDNIQTSPSPQSPFQEKSNPFSKTARILHVSLCTCCRNVPLDGTEYVGASVLAIDYVLYCSGKPYSDSMSFMIGHLELPCRGKPFERLSFTFTAISLLDAMAFLYSSLLTLRQFIDVIDVLQQRHGFDSLFGHNNFRLYNSQRPTAIYSPSTHRQQPVNHLVAVNQLPTYSFTTQYSSERSR